MAPVESVYDITYDVLLLAWTAILDLFFREVRPRGAHLVPKDGPIIFVAAPHANQFVDPFIVMRQARFEAGRRIAFLTAEKSMKRPFVGLMARLTRSIPVARAQDSAKTGTGTIYQQEGTDALTIYGRDTKFSNECMVGGALALPGGVGKGEITEIISDTEVRIKKEIKDEKALEMLVEGSSYKVLPYIDQSKLYKHVYDELNRGQCIGVFPEGGSHDRTDLLPLKAGVTIMALGAMANNPDLDVKIVPCGLNYFHPHRFRSRAVIEFGSPISVAPELVDEFKRGGADKREACQKLLDIIYNALRSVTVNTPDYETLMVIQAGRRLYKPAHGRKLHISQVVELNRRFVAGYMHFKDEPKVKELRARVMAYNQLLRYHGFRDHQVEHAKIGGARALILFLYRLGLLGIWGSAALPGLVLNAPIFIAASILSHQKAKEALAGSTVKIYGRDVLATWKLLVTLGLTPVLYTIYAIAVLVYSIRSNFTLKNKILAPLSVYVFMPMISFAALRFGEVGMDIYKSLRPLFLSIFASTRYPITNLRLVREQLSQNVIEIINEYGPRLYPDFDANRLAQMSRPPLKTRSSHSSDRSFNSDTSRSLFANPIDWLDEKVFNWDAKTPESSDVDEVSFFVEGERVSLGKRSRNSSWASGLNELSMTSPMNMNSPLSPTTPGGSRRSRTSSLNEGFRVEAMRGLPRTESLISVTQRMNSVREEREARGEYPSEKRLSFTETPHDEPEDAGLLMETKSSNGGAKLRRKDVSEDGYAGDAEGDGKKSQ